MSIEDDLLDMFKYVDIGEGQNINVLLNTLIRNTQISTLKMLRQEIERNINRLQDVAKAESKASADLNPYNILGVEQSATKEEIVKAFRKKARVTHPDAGGSNEEFIKVMAAYEAIKQFRGWK